MLHTTYYYIRCDRGLQLINKKNICLALPRYLNKHLLVKSSIAQTKWQGLSNLLYNFGGSMIGKIIDQTPQFGSGTKHFNVPMLHYTTVPLC